MSLGSAPQSFTIAVAQTAPIDALTSTIFISTTAFGVGCMRHLPFARISLGVNNSHGFTLNAAESIDGGTTWRTFYTSGVVAAPAANTINGPYDFLVDAYQELRLQVVNGGTTQTTWELMCRGHENRQPGI